MGFFPRQSLEKTILFQELFEGIFLEEDNHKSLQEANIYEQGEWAWIGFKHQLSFFEAAVWGEGEEAFVEWGEHLQE